MSRAPPPPVRAPSRSVARTRPGRDSRRACARSDSAASLSDGNTARARSGYRGHEPGSTRPSHLSRPERARPRRRARRARQTLRTAAGRWPLAQARHPGCRLRVDCDPRQRRQRHSNEGARARRGNGYGHGSRVPPSSRHRAVTGRRAGPVGRRRSTVRQVTGFRPPTMQRPPRRPRPGATRRFD